MRWYTSDCHYIPMQFGAEMNVSDSPNFALDVHQPWMRHLETSEQFQVTCHEGSVWVSLEGDPLDHVLTAGQSAWLQGPGLVIAEAMDKSQISIQVTRERARA